MIFLLILALVFLCYIKSSKSVALLFSALLLIVSAYLITGSSDLEYQGLIALGAAVWLLVLYGVYRMNSAVDRFRIQKG